ncbi:MAG: hypothetical protein LBO07_00255 [Coriobacteriales bacterium]|nr:hypothetical protein [Coriobacteriales bacterium]
MTGDMTQTTIKAADSASRNRRLSVKIGRFKPTHAKNEECFLAKNSHPRVGMAKSRRIWDTARITSSMNAAEPNFCPFLAKPERSQRELSTKNILLEFPVSVRYTDAAVISPG